MLPSFWFPSPNTGGIFHTRGTFGSVTLAKRSSGPTLDGQLASLRPI